MKRNELRIAAAVVGTISAMSLTCVLTACSTITALSGPKREFLPLMEYDFHDLAHADEGAGQALRVMTLNLAHGRCDGPHQLFQRTATIEAHLDEITSVIQREQPHIVAFQEADAAAFWSGHLSHVGRISEGAHLRNSTHGEHVRGNHLSYGTALASTEPMTHCASYTFDTSFPTLTKGFVVSTVAWPGQPEREIDVVSLHLDFLRDGVRERQVDELVGVLRDSGRPVIVMGDFNCDGTRQTDAVNRVIDKLGLKAYRPDATGMSTFDRHDKRLDWILVSREFEFASYDVLPDTLSDHKAVVSELVWVDG